MLVYTVRVLNQLLRGYFSPPKISKPHPGTVSFDVAFRCFPVDWSHAFNHLNNAKYFRIAELTRWRAHTTTGDAETLKKRGAVFLVAQQTARYHKEIFPFQKYIVRTTVTSPDKKWMYFEHAFQQHPSDVKAGQEPVRYTTVLTKAVMKDRTGKTIRVDELKGDFYSSIIPNNNAINDKITSPQ